MIIARSAPGIDAMPSPVHVEKIMIKKFWNYMMTKRYVILLDFLPMTIIYMFQDNIWTFKIGILIMFIFMAFLIFIWNMCDDINSWKDKEIELLQEQRNLYRDLSRELSQRIEEKKYGV